VIFAIFTEVCRVFLLFLSKIAKKNQQTSVKMAKITAKSRRQITGLKTIKKSITLNI